MALLTITLNPAYDTQMRPLRKYLTPDELKSIAYHALDGLDSSKAEYGRIDGKAAIVFHDPDVGHIDDLNELIDVITSAISEPLSDVLLRDVDDNVDVEMSGIVRVMDNDDGFSRHGIVIV